MPEAHSDGPITHGETFAVGRTRRSRHDSQRDGEQPFAVCHPSGTRQISLPCVVATTRQKKATNGVGMEIQALTSAALGTRQRWNKKTKKGPRACAAAVVRLLPKSGPSAVQEVRTPENLMLRDRMSECLERKTVRRWITDGPPANVLKSWKKF